MATESVLPENDTATLTNRFRKKAHDLVDNTADQAELVEQHMGEKANIAGEVINKNKQRAEQQIKQQYQTISKKAKDNPLITLGLVFAAGALIGRTVSR